MKQESKVPYDFNPDFRHPSYLIRKKLYNAIRKYSQQLNGKLMDFGCGTKPYKSLFQVEQYIGVDYEGEGHSHEGEDIDIFYNGRVLPFPDNSFDSVFSSEVFEHIFNIEEILKEIHRVLKPGGKILVTCPFIICEHEIPNDYTRFTSFAIKKLFENSGFKVLEYEKAGNHVEAIMQLRITYIHLHILPAVKKIPIIRSSARFLIYTVMNTWAYIKSKLLPDRDDLYLNNIILCEKL